MYNSLNNYLKNRFGCKVYKLALDGGMTCPNRDGKVGSRGCIFCSDFGSGDFAVKKCDDINLQIEQAKQLVNKKAKDAKYIAYFQSYTNTYADVDKLKSIFIPAINHPEVVVLSIATRPDCLPDEVLSLLNELNKIKPVWVELGLQTIHKESAEYIRRGYELSCFEKAVKDLKCIGIDVIAHVILGLPYETKEQMLQTVMYLNEIGINGVKLQLLHVIKNTDLEIEYRNGKFNTLALNEYIEILEDCIRVLNSEIVIHRITGDGAKSTLVAPLWSANKKYVLNEINKAFERDNIIQGQYANSN